MVVNHLFGIFLQDGERHFERVQTRRKLLATVQVAKFILTALHCCWLQGDTEHRMAS